jgi:hypothetical protein
MFHVKRGVPPTGRTSPHPSGCAPRRIPRTSDPPDHPDPPYPRAGRTPTAPAGGQNSGRLAGTPVRRGYRSGQGRSWRRTWNADGDVTLLPTTRPNSKRGSAGHRSGDPPGGSATTRVPPTARNGAPHSAVTAGGPKLRATTKSNVARRAGSRPATSARPMWTSVRWPTPSSSTAARRNWPRVTLPSSSTQLMVGRARASGSPGRPPPLPISRARPTSGGMRSSPSNALSMCGSTGPGPRKPSSRDRSRTRRRAP